MALGAKVVILIHSKNFSSSAGETERHLLCHLLYPGAFAPYAYWWVILNPIGTKREKMVKTYITLSVVIPSVIGLNVGEPS
jgi:hypothetical protein